MEVCFIHTQAQLFTRKLVPFPFLSLPLSLSFHFFFLFCLHIDTSTMTLQGTVTEKPFNTNMSRHNPKAERVVITEEHTVLCPEEKELKQQEENLKLVQELRSSPEWIEAISHGYLTDSARKHSLTAHSLRGQDKILRRPLKFFNQDKTKCIVILHLGDHL